MSLLTAVNVLAANVSISVAMILNIWVFFPDIRQNVGEKLVTLLPDSFNKYVDFTDVSLCDPATCITSTLDDPAISCLTMCCLR